MNLASSSLLVLRERDHFQRQPTCRIHRAFQDAEIEGIHENFRARNLNYTIEVRERDKSTEVYLTTEELRGLYDMKLSGVEEKVRDVFLIGCFLGQRVSDYGRIEPDWFSTTTNGVKVINIQQKKTGNEVCIPIVGNQLETLLEKYNYCVPKICEVEIDRTIKDICERLSVFIPSLAVKEKTILKKHEKHALYTNKEGGRKQFEINEKGECIKPKWAMVASHTARRTCITNMYLARKSDGTPKYTIGEMMHVSGHKTETQFRGYIKCSLNEYAEMVAAANDKDGDNLF